MAVWLGPLICIPIDADQSPNASASVEANANAAHFELSDKSFFRNDLRELSSRLICCYSERPQTGPQKLARVRNLPELSSKRSLIY